MTKIPAQDLQPGQRIRTGPGRVETVTAPTERDQHGGAAIHTDQHTILTGLPCDVTIAD